MNDLTGKTAVVTGGASGIGFAIAERFGSAGMKVVLADVEEPALDAAVERLASNGVDALGVVTDVSEIASVEALGGEHPRHLIAGGHGIPEVDIHVLILNS